MKSLKMKLIYRKHKKAILGTLGAVLLAGLVFFFSYFHVTKVEVMGTARYTDEQVRRWLCRGRLWIIPFLQFCSIPGWT